jgi:myo-inositol-1(or 4)-monophosphatase
MLKNMLHIILEAGDKMLGFDRPEVYQKEGHANFVTQADIEVQAFLMEKLAKAVPEAVFFAEEKENEALTDALTFVIDPIDGTTNFMRGRKCSSISVALLKNREPVLAAILNPYAKELFHAEKGKGAFLNGQPIHVSGQEFQKALVSMGTSPYDSVLAAKTMKAAEKFLLAAGDLRRTGSADIDLCDVACGRSDIYWELILSPWDFAAGALIVTEAGGMICSPGSGALRFDQKTPVLAANPICFEQAEKMLLAAIV